MKFNVAIRKGIRYVENNPKTYLDPVKAPSLRGTAVKPYCGCALGAAICGADETLELAQLVWERYDFKERTETYLGRFLKWQGVEGAEDIIEAEEMPPGVPESLYPSATAAEVVDHLHQRCGWSPTRIADWLRSIGR